MKPETKILQSQLAGYCRVPQYYESIEGTKPDRLHNYRRLVFNIVEDTLQNAYPITQTLLTEEEWMTLVNDFFGQHDCQSPQLWKMPFELVEFVENTAYHEKLGKPYLLELLYFEWLELEIYMGENKPHDRYVTLGDMLKDVPVINPDHKLLQLTYPVHIKNPADLEAAKGNYFVLIYRHKTEYTVNFIELSPFLAVVFSTVNENKISFLNAVNMVANANGINVDDDLLQKVAAWATQLVKDTAVLGFAG